MDGVIVTSLSTIDNPKGSIYHAMKESDVGYTGFGEAYFSTVSYGEIKGWKKHTEMTLNLIVISGEIEFVLYDLNDFMSIRLSNSNYCRLTVKPGIWMGFKGISTDRNMLLNIASIEHNPNESVNMGLEELPYEW